MQNLPEAIVATMALFERQDGAIAPFLADDVVLKPPTYWRNWSGRPAVSRVLDFAARNLDALRYVRCFQEGEHHLLQFDASIAGMTLCGVDAVTLNADGMIAEFEIFARPPNAVVELSKRMLRSIHNDPFFERYKTDT